jgi:hypothetical protein
VAEAEVQRCQRESGALAHLFEARLDAGKRLLLAAAPAVLQSGSGSVGIVEDGDGGLTAAAAAYARAQQVSSLMRNGTEPALRLWQYGMCMVPWLPV